MILIGEKLNSSVPKTLAALNAGDTAYIKRVIKKQALSGADYIDVNTALTGEREADNMLLVTGMVGKYSRCGVMLDSPDPNVIEKCLPELSGMDVIINSVSLDEKYDGVIEAAKAAGAGLVCMPIAGKRIPDTADERYENACAVIEKLRFAGFCDDKLYIDALTEAVATNGEAAITTLRTVELIKKGFPNAHVICGLSNVSFGLPARSELNAAFLLMLMYAGLDTAILDTTSERVMTAVRTGTALLGEDEYCIDYIGYMRSLAESGK